MWLAVVAGCYRPSETLCDGACVDTVVPPDLSPTAVCAGVPEGLLPNVCFDPEPQARTIAAGEIDTDNMLMCDRPVTGGSDALCIIAGGQLRIEGTVRAKGSRPLVLWSASTITLPAGAVIDVASHSSGGDQLLGAGANDARCPNEMLDGGKVSESGGNRQVGAGGCGGPFGGAGGSAGRGQVTTQFQIFNDCVAPPIELREVRGGCRGGHGGLSDTASELDGGASGGAVYLMARGDITINGTIDARAIHASIAIANSTVFPGGGGGGSGGLIGFDIGGMLILDGAVLNAAGSGGSSGAAHVNNSIPTSGLVGNDAALNPPVLAAQTGETTGANFGGGSGARGGDVALGEAGGGGGGGGGLGHVVAYPKGPSSKTGALLLPDIVAPQ